MFTYPEESLLDQIINIKEICAMTKVVVIGGGSAGISAAVGARKAGAEK